MSKITHELKVHPQFWQSLKSAARPFEVRRNDRKFTVGDLCVFREWSPEFGYVDRDVSVAYPISYILHHEDFPIGVPVGFVVLGFGVLQEKDDV